jgi:hypothetical protein
MYCTVYGTDMAQGLRASGITGETHNITFYVTTVKLILYDFFMKGEINFMWYFKWKVKLILCDFFDSFITVTQVIYLLSNALVCGMLLKPAVFQNKWI